ALPIAYDVPAHSSSGRSLGMSPKATTSLLSTPSSEHSAASVDALVTPNALISTSDPTEDQVVVTRVPTAASTTSQNSCGPSSGWRASSLTTAPPEISSSGPRDATGRR